MNGPIEYRFGAFRLLPQAQQLFRGDVEVALTARAHALLLVLVSSAGQLLSKDALMSRVWAGLVVEENNLAVQIGVLRKLLGADVIATVAGRGYRFALPVHTSPATQAVTARGNLPAAGAPLFGRDDDLLALQACCDMHRLVTVVGAGGIGKSRLALAAARGDARVWRDGVWWLELAGLGDPALLVPSMAQALGVSLQGRDAVAATLATALAGHEALLVIDNCEHLLDALAALVDLLLKAAPGVRVLATSQEPLRLDTEQQFRLNPLAVPADAHTPGARDHGAVALLVSRVRAAQAGYALSDQDLPLAIDLCRRLDGLPLAIELAAARVPLLGLRTVHDRLDERFRLLTAGSRAALRRHQTLRAAIAWSHALLDDAQRTVFMRLGVFSGGFTLGLAQALCADARMDEWAVLDQLAALVDKSLVVLEGGAGQRYRLLESTRAYALEQLAGAKQTTPCVARHGEVMLAFLRRTDDANLEGEMRTDQYAAQVLPELDNLRAAYAWADGADGDRRVAIGLAAHISPLIDYSLEFVDWMLAQWPQVVPGAEDEVTAARFWRGLAASNMVGYVPLADQMAAAQRSAVLYRQAGLHRRLSSSLRRVVAWSLCLGDIESARAAADEAGSLLKPEWGPEFHMGVLRSRSQLARAAGQLDVAIACSAESVRLARDVFGDWRLEVIEQTVLADLLWETGRIPEAVAMLDMLLQGMRERPASDYEWIDALETLMWIHSDAGHLEAAKALLPQALPVMKRMPRFSRVGAAHLLWRLGQLAHAARVLAPLNLRLGRDPAEMANQPNGRRLLAEVRAAVVAAFDPVTLAALQAGSENMDHAEVCTLLAQAAGQG